MKLTRALAAVWAMAVILAGAGGAVAGKPPRPPPPPPANPAIAFTWAGSLKVMNADGSNVVVLVQATNNTRRSRGISCASPDWSRDGMQIVFGSNADNPNGDGVGVYVVNRDGTGRHKILPVLGSLDGLWGILPVWSPGPVPGAGAGRPRIAYSAPAVAFGPRHLWIADVDGTDAVDLGGSPNGDIGSPTWSPDGTRLLCEIQGPTIRHEFGWVDFAGAGVLEARLYPAPLAGHDVGRPSWSKTNPNLLVVEATLDWPTTTPGFYDLWVIDPLNLATPAVPLTSTSTLNEYHGSYSQDDSKIVFSASQVIEVMNADGTGRQSLGVSGHYPSWRRNP